MDISSFYISIDLNTNNLLGFGTKSVVVFLLLFDIFRFFSEISIVKAILCLQWRSFFTDDQRLIWFEFTHFDITRIIVRYE